ncbi:MAG: cysteine synthase family protein [Dehalococcoidia bacterium]
MAVADLLDLVGDTPLVELKRLSPKPGVRIFAKLEGQNPTGSIKDRIALGLVRAAERRGALTPGDTIIEASSGNTAIALAFVAKQLGYRARVVLPRGIAPSVRDILEVYEVEITWAEAGAGMAEAIELAQRIADAEGLYLLGQFSDPVNVDVHYRTTGAEIVRDLPDVDVFVAGIGTSGTVMGVGRRLREVSPEVQIIGIEPKLGEQLMGLRSLGEGFIPPLLDLGMLSGRYLVDSAQAFACARELARAEGIIAGASSGATLHGAIRAAERLDSGNIVVIFADGGWKYLPSRPWEAAERGDASLDEIHWW